MQGKSFAKLSFESKKNTEMTINGVNVKELHGAEANIVFAKTDKYRKITEWVFEI